MASHLGNGRSILLSYGGMPQRGIRRKFRRGRISCGVPAEGMIPAGRKDARTRVASEGSRISAAVNAPPGAAGGLNRVSCGPGRTVAEEDHFRDRPFDFFACTVSSRR